MSTRTELDSNRYDFTTMGIFLLLIIVGWVMIFAVEYTPESYTGLLNLKKNYGKQLMFIGISAVLFGIIQLIDAKLIEIFAIIFYVFCLLLLVGVLFTKPINGSTSWYHIGGFSLQPSEFAKVATCLLLTSYLGRAEVRVQNFKQLMTAAGIIALPMGLVLLQGDLGSTLVFSSFAIVLFRAGLNGIIYILGLLVVALSILALKFDDMAMIILLLLVIGNLLLAWVWQQNIWHVGGAVLAAIVAVRFYAEGQMWLTFVLSGLVFVALLFANVAKNWQISLIVGLTFVLSTGYAFSVSTFFNNVLAKHQQERIWVWLRPEKCDPQGALYNVEQSKYAIGSGGIRGKGFLQGERTKLDYVPEQSTDFIFCTVGEEWGFMGTSAVILLFLAFLIRLLVVAERQRSNFTRFYAYGAAGILFFHFLINIGMTIGLIPVVGIPLPLISYGGSSLFAFTILIGILIKLDSDRIF